MIYVKGENPPLVTGTDQPRINKFFTACGNSLGG